VAGHQSIGPVYSCQRNQSVELECKHRLRIGPVAGESQNEEGTQRQTVGSDPSLEGVKTAEQLSRLGRHPSQIQQPALGRARIQGPSPANLGVADGRRIAGHQLNPKQDPARHAHGPVAQEFARCRR